jgi:hypothetical protein
LSERITTRFSRVTGSGPIHKSGPDRRWKKGLKIAGVVLVPITALAFVWWSAWSDTHGGELEVTSGGGAPSGASADAAPPAAGDTARTAPPPSGNAPAPPPAGAGDEIAQNTVGTGDEIAPTTVGETVARAGETPARPQRRDGGTQAEPRRASSAASASGRGAAAGSRSASADAGVAAASSPDGGRDAAARSAVAAAPRGERAAHLEREDDRRGYVRVARFSPSGGSTMEGRIVDIDTGRALAGVVIEARYDRRLVETESDHAGVFKMPGMVPGSQVVVWVGGRRDRWVAERFDVSVPDNGKNAELGVISLLDGDEVGSRIDGWIGMYVARRGGQVKVSAVNAWVPADKAGIQEGDTVLAVDGREVRGLGARAVGFLLRGPTGSSMTLEVASKDGKRRKLTLERVRR